MKSPDGAAARPGGLFNKARRDRELAEELESHLRMQVEKNLRAGLAGEPARPPRGAQGLAYLLRVIGSTPPRNLPSRPRPSTIARDKLRRSPMNHTRFFRATVLCLALALTLCAPVSFYGQARQSAQGQQGLPPAQYAPSHDYDQRHIALDLRFDWEREQAEGTATITFAPLRADLSRVEFDAGNMTFSSVRLASGTPLKDESDAAHEKLSVTLDRAYQPSDVLTVVISYHTNGTETTPGLPGFGSGLRFIKPTSDNPKRPRQIWSQGEAEQNHFWFPCYDHPNDFATTEINATVEKPLTVISNGRLVETKDNRDNTRTFHWKIDEPHATYLTSIVVGEDDPVA